MNREILIKQLMFHEGVELKPYKDTVGKLTIGVGRNLTDVGISLTEAEFLLSNDIDKVIDDLDRTIPFWKNLSEVRQHVLLDMCFNLGISGLLKFKNTLNDIEDGHYHDAAVNMLKSKWARQVGQRADRLVEMMRTNEFPVV